MMRKVEFVSQMMIELPNQCIKPVRVHSIRKCLLLHIVDPQNHKISLIP